MSEKDEKPTIQNVAINAYFDSLLHETNTSSTNKKNITPIVLEPEEKTDDIPKVTHTPVEPKSSEIIIPESEQEPDKTENNQTVIGLEQLIAEIPLTITQTIAEVKNTTLIDETTDAQLLSTKKITDEVKITAEVAIDVETETICNENGVPEWAETRFQCLLFNVAGLSMAVPLVKLNSVIPWDENITSTPNQTSWYLGLVQHLQSQVKIIDTALLVLPENRQQNLQDESEGRLSHILLVDDFKWGLACSSIGDVIWLNKEEVKWRKNKSNKIWLSGTSLEHLCAIMDTQVFARMLTESTL